METLLTYIAQLDPIEVTGVVLSLLFLYFEIKGSNWLWPLGILSSALYIVVFYQALFYAEMSLQGYYLVISIYGWNKWVKGSHHKPLRIHHIQSHQALWISLIGVLLFIFIRFILINFTNSPVATGDALITTLSILATWLLTQKIMEQWGLWVIANGLSAVLFFQKQLYPTAFLYLLFTVMSVVGYFQWIKLKQQQDDAF